MKTETLLKAKNTFLYSLLRVITLFLITQTQNFSKGIWGDEESWQLFFFGCIVMHIAVLFSASSFELQTSKLTVRFVLFFRTPKVYNINDIIGVNIVFGRGSRLYIQSIIKEDCYYYTDISKKSMSELILQLKEMGVEANIFESGFEYKNYKQNNKI